MLFVVTYRNLVSVATGRQLCGTPLPNAGHVRVMATPAGRGPRAAGHHQWVPETVPATTPPARPAPPRRLVLRVPGSALVGVFFLVLCESAVAFAAPWLTTLYLIPLGLAVWIVRTRTVVDAEQLVVRTVLGRRVLPWTDVASLRVREGKWVRAVLADGSEVVLPTVRTRHLPALAIVTGRIPDPSEPAPTPE